MSILEKPMQTLTLALRDLKVLIGLALLTLISLVSLIAWATMSNKNRYVLTFEHMNKEGLYVETRYLPKVPKKDRLRLFVDDMLLGPVGDRYKLLFPRGTTITAWSLEGKTLNVSLSEEALYRVNYDILQNKEGATYLDGKDSSQNKEGAEIFRKNVFRNFRSIDIINLYIGGRKIYED